MQLTLLSHLRKPFRYEAPRLVLPSGIVGYAMSLANKHRHELGFIPAMRYSHAHAAGRLRPQYLNGDPCGYLLHGPLRSGRPCHVWQCVIQVDARRLASATELVAQLKLDATAAACSRILLRCATDLDANLFWRACGFELVRTLVSSPRSGRQVNLWRCELPSLNQPLLW